MNEQETTTDIIAWLRRPRECENGYLTAWRDEIADRLEAAHKRELGDVAKLREAMKHIKDRLPHMLQYMRVHWEDASSGGYFDELMLVIDAALAAPPRNCDVYNSESCRLAYHLHGDGLMTMQAFAEWLFAPATEKEGGNNAD
jgi:hypothetical protein